MPHRLSALASLVVATSLSLSGCADRAEVVPSDAAAPNAGYQPQAVFCADGSGKICGVMPSMIGPDPELNTGVGYPGLDHDIDSFERDAQTPFDNFAWQMFVALNQVQGGQYVWQGYTRVEEVFGPAPSPLCDNPGNLPVFSLTSKSDGQPSDRDEEFLQAATDKPLIDRNGNWTVFERRLNDVELAYLKNDKWDLTTLAGQKAFVEAKYTVDFTESEDAPSGALGAIELKLAWRILDTNQGDDPRQFLTLDALLAVDATQVRGGGGKPICAQVELGLVGFHIIQKNPTRYVLLPQWIWASFEHQDNGPMSPNACDPVTSECFVKPPLALCTAPTGDTNVYSYFDGTCKQSDGQACPVNTAPALLDGEKDYLWSPQQPYAAPYRYGGAYGTQVARCYQIYGFTQDLNEQWQPALQSAGSVLANYTLIGSQWGGKVEPRPGVFVNGGVPAFLSNLALETYIQTADYGTCIGCHQGATLAYTTTENGKTVTYDANFSFLLGLAE